MWSIVQESSQFFMVWSIVLGEWSILMWCGEAIKRVCLISNMMQAYRLTYAFLW